MANQQGNSSFSDAFKEANDLLNSLESSPFSDKAYAQLKEKINDYISSVIIESIKISRRQKADIVSLSHIDQASDNLISKRRGKWKYLSGTIGGIFLGTTASNAFGMLVLNATFNVSGIIATIVIGVIGAFLIALNLNGE